jgi:hypothetical protein
VTAPLVNSGSQIAAATIFCNAGDIALGGYYSSPLGNTYISVSEPRGTNGWYIRVAGSIDPGDSAGVRCVNI